MRAREHPFFAHFNVECSRDFLNHDHQHQHQHHHHHYHYHHHHYFAQMIGSKYVYKYVNCVEIQQRTCIPVDGNLELERNPSLSAVQASLVQLAAPLQPTSLANGGHTPHPPVIQQQPRPAMATPAPGPTKVSSEKLEANGGGGGHTSESTAAAIRVASPSEPKVVLVVLHSNATGEPIVRQF